MVRTFGNTPWLEALQSIARKIGEPAQPTDVLARLDRLSNILDSAFAVPGTRVRFGAEAALSLIPGVGPLAGAALSSYLLIEAVRLGLPVSVLARMVANIAIDFAISSVPVVGLIGDLFFKANTRNMKILRSHLT